MNKLSLYGTWKLSGGGHSCNASIPGDFHSALLNAGIISDPFYGFNEKDCLWVGKTDWTISRNFFYDRKQNLSNNARAILELTEADTFFTVFINGKECGKGQNQFARYRFDITDALIDGQNEIKILFESAEKKSNEIAESLPYPVPFMKYDVYSPNRNLARKCQCNGGWDWGPCIMVSGLYGNAFIETISDGLFESTTVSYKFDEKLSKCTVFITCKYDSFCKKSKEFYFTINGDGINEGKACAIAELSEGINTINAEIQIDNPPLWKTSGELAEEGLSENKLFNLCISTTDSCGSEQKDSKKICFSTLKSVSEKDNSNGKEGRCLYFENNGRKIFAKGSNWIPADSLPSRMTEERYTKLLKSAQDAGQNCIRVWGGGIFEKEIFYELCDRLGLIVWQDCMFACSLYPATESFTNEIINELEYQIPRLSHHACIGIWCGNNENFGALNWFEESKNNQIRYLLDYDRLYNGVIGKEIKKLDPNRIFWPSSPCSGPDDYGDNWHSDNSGDMHFWSVWHERKNFEAYMSIKPRFVSEFGYESFPSIECINSFAEEKDFNFTSPVMEYHQRSPSGNSIILENFSRYFRFPQGFENMIYLSQVQQALAIKTAVEWWHSLKPHCMGALIWQLNDVWPCPSWSSLEYDGKWKLLHYESKKFFANLSIPTFFKDNILNVFAVNDTKTSVNAKINIRFIKFDGTEYKQELIFKQTLAADSSNEIYTEQIALEDKDSFFVYVTMEYNGKIIDNTAFPDLYKHSRIERSEVKISKIEKDEETNALKITLSTQKPAFFVSLDVKGKIKGRFSENMFTMLPEKNKEVFFNPESDMEFSIQDFEKSLLLFDLSNI